MAIAARDWGRRLHVRAGRRREGAEDAPLFPAKFRKMKEDTGFRRRLPTGRRQTARGVPQAMQSAISSATLPTIRCCSDAEKDGEVVVALLARFGCAHSSLR